jgi:hypothetical protein
MVGTRGAYGKEEKREQSYDDETWRKEACCKT